MKLHRIVVASFVLLAALSAAAQSGPQQSFDQMKAFTGTWQGKDNMGGAVEVSYRMTSGGVLVSEIQTAMKGHEEDMISMIHMDGARLLLTHYCAIGNQPRMTATASPDGKTITFNFLDATNLARPDAGHMQQVIFTSIDANHHIEEWHFADHGKETVARFELERKG